MSLPNDSEPMMFAWFAPRIAAFLSAPRCSHRAIFLLGMCMTGLAMATMAGCYKVVNTEDPSIEITRDVHIKGLIGDASGITTAPGGGFVVVGDQWAVATDANGQELWRYADPDSDATKTDDRSEYHGVVAMSGGKTLLCGFTRTGHGSIGFVTILNSSGQLVEKRPLTPTPPDGFVAVTLDECKRWGDATLLLGTAFANKTAYGWLVKLDDTGAKQWEIVDGRLVAVDAAEMSNHNMALAGMMGMTDSTTLIQINPQGQIASTQEIPSFPDRVVRSTVPFSTLRVQTNMGRKNPSIIILDEKYKEIAPPIAAGIIGTVKGRAWALRDGSVALFGNVFGSGGVYQAVAARIGQRDKPDAVRALSLPPAGSVSAGIYDAIPISDNTFVAARDVDNDLVLSWIKFK